MATEETATCPACGSEDVRDRKRRFGLFAILLVVCAIPLVIDGIIDGYDWMHILGIGGLVLVALMNAVCAVVAPWQCQDCKHVWR